MNNAIPLTALSRRLAKATGGHATYRMIYGAVLDGRLPAEQIRGRWHVADAPIGDIAKRLGLVVNEALDMVVCGDQRPGDVS